MTGKKLFICFIEYRFASAMAEVLTRGGLDGVELSLFSVLLDYSRW